MAENINDKLDSVRAQIKAVSNSDQFGISDTVQTQDPTLRDDYKSSHKSSVRCTVFFGPVWIAEVVGIEHREENSKTPIYHYASEYFNDILDGKYIVRGNLYMYEKQTNDLLATIAKYKELLRRDKYQSDLVKDIVAQRNNLFQADLTTKLISQYGPAKAAEIATAALKKINSELITGRDWDIPKLIVVSGDISDPSPVIDIFEDVTFDTTSKAILADGATQIRVISWFGKRRPVRDTPEAVSGQEKWRIDFDKTVKSYMDSFFKTVRSLVTVKIKEFPMPVGMNPNNIGYVGTLPAAIAGWGPDMCLTPVKVEQYGLPDKMAFSYNIHTYKADPAAAQATNILEQNKQFQYRTYETYEYLRYAGLINPWRFFFPDPDYLMQCTHFITRALPTHRGLSYAWTVPTPSIPGTLGDDLPNNGDSPIGGLVNPLIPANDYTYREEDTHAVTGATLTQAFAFLSMYDSYDEKNAVVRAPVRGFTYIPPVQIEKKEAGENSEIRILETVPIVGTDLIALTNSGFNLPADLTPGKVQYTKTTYDALMSKDGKIVGENNIKQDNPNAIPSSTLPNQTYGDEWYVLAPVINTELTNPVISNIIENITLGLFQNTDKVNQYDIDLRDAFQNYPFGIGVDNVSIQVYPLGMPNDLVQANSFLGKLGLSFGSHARVNRAIAASYLLNADCLPQDSIDYVYSLEGFNSQGPNKRLLFACTWTKDIIDKTVTAKKMPLMLVRVISAKPGSPGDVFSASIGQNQYESAATTMPCSKAVYYSFIRCDRSYVSFDQRWPQDFFNALSRVSTNAGMDVLRPSIARSVQLFAGTMRIMRHDSVYRALTENLAAGPVAAGSVAAGVLVSTTGVALKTIGIFGSAVLDSAEGIWNVAINLPLVNFAVDTLESLGINLKTIFQDTKIVRGSKSNPKLNLERVSAFTEGERYILLKDQLTTLAMNDIYSEISRLISESPEKFEGDEILLNGGPNNTKKNSKLQSRVDTQLVGAIYRYFIEPEWSTARLYGESLDRIIGSFAPEFKQPLITNAGSSTSDVYIIQRKGTKPSAFVLDEAIKNPDSYKVPDPDPKGIIFT